MATPENPVADIIFRVQLRRWVQDQSKELGKMDQVTARLKRLAKKSPAELSAAIEAEVKALEPVAASPWGG